MWKYFITITIVVSSSISKQQVEKHEIFKTPYPWTISNEDDIRGNLRVVKLTSEFTDNQIVNIVRYTGRIIEAEKFKNEVIFIKLDSVQYRLESNWLRAFDCECHKDINFNSTTDPSEFINIFQLSIDK